MRLCQGIDVSGRVCRLREHGQLVRADAGHQLAVVGDGLGADKDGAHIVCLEGIGDRAGVDLVDSDVVLAQDGHGAV